MATTPKTVTITITGELGRLRISSCDAAIAIKIIAMSSNKSSTNTYAVMEPPSL